MPTIDPDVMAVIAWAVSCPDPAAGIRLLEHGVSVILGRAEQPEKWPFDLLPPKDLIALRDAEMARARQLYPDRLAATLDPETAEIDDWKEYLSGR